MIYVQGLAVEGRCILPILSVLQRVCVKGLGSMQNSSKSEKHRMEHLQIIWRTASNVLQKQNEQSEGHHNQTHCGGVLRVYTIMSNCIG